jgi:hypothetical protein
MKYVLDSNVALKWVLPEPDVALVLIRGRKTVAATGTNRLE